MGDDIRDSDVPAVSRFNISVVSQLVVPKGYVRNAQLSREEVHRAHWNVMEHCTEAAKFINKHRELVLQVDPDVTDEQRSLNFFPYFRDWVCNNF